MKLLILSDSIALPRTKPELVAYEETWPFLMKKHFNVHQVSIGGAIIKDLWRQVGYHIHFNPDIVVLQCGIVDCAPRFISRFEKDLLMKIPFAGSRIIKHLNNERIRNIRKITYTQPKDFGKYCSNILNAFASRAVFAIGIVPGYPAYEKELPGIMDNIKLYNQILQKKFDKRFVSLNDFPSAGLMSDFHHVNAAGHQFIFQQLIKAISTDD